MQQLEELGAPKPAGLSAVSLALLLLAPLYTATLVWLAQTERFEAANYGFAIAIGLLVGGTEMMGRYRDEPFAPLATVPGLFYILVNGGAAALAYFLLRTMDVEMEPTVRVLTAGLGAMAFFRSGLFNVRVGDADIAVGPNLVLQIILQALDRAYDRLRAVPRSQAVVGIMSGIAFSEVKDALPALCFNLMQNVTDAEAAAIRTQAEELDRSTTMSDESKILSLGLALFNVVGGDTLKAAVAALGSRIKGFRMISEEIAAEAARIEPDLAIAALPRICAELQTQPTPDGQPSPPMPPRINALTAEGQLVLILYRLVAHYGDACVLAAVKILANQAGGDPAQLPEPPPET